ncbi:MAG: 3'-5' exonuclease, partial [Clostridiales bacterium]|nr:3'-5' exonuclease [Clostridiales bacterium]
ILLNYITSVLPDLDVYGVSQMTMEQLFIRLLYEDWEPKTQKVGSLDQKDGQAFIKGSYDWFHDLEEFCDRYEKKMIPMQEVCIEKNEVQLLSEKRIEAYVKDNHQLSMQSKINGLNELLLSKLENELSGRNVSYSAEEKKELTKLYSFHFGKDVWKGSIYDLYHDFLECQSRKGTHIEIKDETYDVYDLAALAYLYKRIKETDGIREASHVIIDEAQDFGMMAYGVLMYCLRGCTYTIMGDVSQNIHFGYGLNDWEELKKLVLTGTYDSFGLLRKSYRNTVEISNFATEILRHGSFFIYPVEPIIRHGNEVRITACEDEKDMLQKTVDTIAGWQKEGHETIAVVCRDEKEAAMVSKQLSTKIEITDSNLETAEFERGVMVLPVEYTKGLEFDAVLIYHPSKENYPEQDQYVKLLYVAATRALHELAVVHLNDLSELIAKPVSDEKRMQLFESEKDPKLLRDDRKGPIKVEMDRLDMDARKKIQITGKEKTKETSSVKREETIIQKKEILKSSSAFEFGAVASSNVLRPKGHSRIDSSIRWVKRSKTCFDLISSYGTLRLTPLDERIIRVQFHKGQEAEFESGYWNYQPKEPVVWSARESRLQYEIATGQIVIRVDKKTGALQFYDKRGIPLLKEKEALPRQMEMEKEQSQTWNYFDWPSKEKLYAKGILDDDMER